MKQEVGRKGRRCPRSRVEKWGIVNLSIRLRQEAIRLVPNQVLVHLNKHPRIKRVLRERLSGTPALPGTLEEVVIRKGPNRGRRLLLDMGTDERRLWMGTYEPWIHRILPEVLGEGGNLWDVGAHIGYYVIAADALSPIGEHLAVEPAPNVQARLRHNLSINRVDSVEVLNAAVSGEPGKVLFSIEEHSMTSRVSDRGGVEVAAVTLDSLLEGRAAPTVIMMDIEGFEGTVVPKATQLLDQIRPMWLMELHGSGGIAAYDALLAHGYRVRCAVEDVPVPQQIPYQRVHALFTPR